MDVCNNSRYNDVYSTVYNMGYVAAVATTHIVLIASQFHVATAAPVLAPAILENPVVHSWIRISAIVYHQLSMEFVHSRS